MGWSGGSHCQGRELHIKHFCQETPRAAQACACAQARACASGRSDNFFPAQKQTQKNTNKQHEKPHAPKTPSTLCRYFWRRNAAAAEHHDQPLHASISHRLPQLPSTSALNNLFGECWLCSGITVCGLRAAVHHAVDAFGHVVCGWRCSLSRQGHGKQTFAWLGSGFRD